MSRIYIEEKPKRVLLLNKGARSEILFRIDKKGYNTDRKNLTIFHFVNFHAIIHFTNDLHHNLAHKKANKNRK